MHLSDRELLELIHEHTHTLIQEIREMSASLQSQLDALTAVVAESVSTFQTVADGIAKEIQQLVDAQGATGVTPAQSAQLQASIDGLTALHTSMTNAVTSLGGDDPVPPPVVNVDPVAFAAAMADARAQGATDVQLQAITALGDGVSAPVSKKQLADAITAALAAAGDGSAPATAAQLTELSALAV